MGRRGPKKLSDYILAMRGSRRVKKHAPQAFPEREPSRLEVAETAVINAMIDGTPVPVKASRIVEAYHRKLRAQAQAERREAAGSVKVAVL
jgi:hypothetical protein